MKLSIAVYGKSMRRNFPLLRQLSVLVLLLGTAGTSALAEAPYVAAGTSEQPSDLGTVQGVLTFEGRTGVGQMRDAWFAFTLSSPTAVGIAVEQPGVTFDLRVVGSRYADGVLRSTAFSHEPSFEHHVDAGTYLLRTYSDQPTNFTATIKAN